MKAQLQGSAVVEKEREVWVSILPEAHALAILLHSDI